MKNSFIRAASAILLLAALATPGLAGGRKIKSPENHDTVISSVTANSISITEDKTPKTFPINQFTEITFKGQKVATTALQPGMAVSVTLGTDGVSASRIAAGDPPVHHEDDRKAVKAPKGWMK